MLTHFRGAFRDILLRLNVSSPDVFIFEEKVFAQATNPLNVFQSEISEKILSKTIPLRH